MNIELVPCSKDRALFMVMARDYVDALRVYDPRIIWDEYTWNKAVWDARFIVDSGIVCGFVVTQEVKYKKARDLLYIAEIYVSPDERSRGVGMGAVKAAASEWQGDVFLYVLNNNAAGKAFWDAAERELGWARTERDDIRREDGCELRVYQA